MNAGQYEAELARSRLVNNYMYIHTAEPGSALEKVSGHFFKRFHSPFLFHSTVPVHFLSSDSIVYNCVNLTAGTFSATQCL